MTVLVTGGAGYIGSHMVLALLDAGEEVVVIDNLSTGFSWVLPPEVPLVVGDMGDQDLIARTIREHRVAAIAHFAAKIVVPESVADPLGYYLNNTVRTRALIEACVLAGVKHFIFSSTAATYGIPEQVPIPETTRTQPINPYGWSKLMTERMLADAGAAHGLSYVALRYFNVAGADPMLRTGQSTPAATHLIKVAVQAALGRRERLDIFGTDYPTPDGTCVRDYIHVADLAAAHVEAAKRLEQGEPVERIYNLGSGDGVSVAEIMTAMAKGTGIDFEPEVAPRRPGDPARIVANGELAARDLGWAMRHTLDEMVASAWEARRGVAQERA